MAKLLLPREKAPAPAPTLAKPADPRAPTFVMLGRNGDILNVLPILKEVADMGQRPTLVVSSAFAGLLTGVSYVDVRTWSGDVSNLPAALTVVRRSSPGAVPLQVYGLPGFTHKRPSFVIDQWDQAGEGMAARWGTLPLVLDHRSPDREAELVAAHVEGGKPLILVATKGHSSPFLHGRELLTTLRATFPSCQILDLTTVKATQFYDLLGLYDKAAALVTIDTGHLHLAHASKVPVCAFIADTPTLWHGSPRRANQFFHARYSTFRKRLPELVATLANLVGVEPQEPQETAKPDAPRLRHVFVARVTEGNAVRRENLAASTWLTVYDEADWSSHPHTTSATVNAKTVLGDGRPLAFIKDIVATALQGAGDDDIIVLTNSDICVLPGITAKIVEVVARGGAGFASRRDFKHLTVPLTGPEVLRGSRHMGGDLFCFTPRWWRKHSDKMPNLLIGCEWWDAVMRWTMKLTGGGEIMDSIYHEKHDSVWELPSVKGKAPQSIYVTLLAKGFRKHWEIPENDQVTMPSAFQV